MNKEKTSSRSDLFSPMPRAIRMPGSVPASVPVLLCLTVPSSFWKADPTLGNPSPPLDHPLPGLPGLSPTQPPPILPSCRAPAGSLDARRLPPAL